ncbi:MAG: sigma-70 family RNA polymerase sigma factor [Bacteroidales bacterium]|nr:sigma-70 family RNA polymerase sigma factor [Bacteroidales bacterium]
MNKADGLGNSSSDVRRKGELFNKYIKPYYDFIRRLCERYTASKHDVDENFNDVLLNLYIYIETYDESRDLRTWIHIVTKRHVFALDEKRRRHDNSIQGTECDIDRVPSCEIDNYDESEDYEKIYGDGIVRTLRSMPQIYRQAFMMQHHGMSLKEIAKALKESGDLKSGNINTVKTRIHVARKIFKESIDTEGNLLPKQ